MEINVRKIDFSEAIILYVDEIMNDCKSIWPEVVDCIKSNGFDIMDEDEAYDIWVTGLLAMDTLYSVKSFNNISKRIYSGVCHYISYKTELLEDWPCKIKEMYGFFCYIYLAIEKDYAKKSVRQKIPEVSTSLAILTGIISGFENIKKGNNFSSCSIKTQKTLGDFHYIILKSLNNWSKINNEYKIKF